MQPIRTPNTDPVQFPLKNFLPKKPARPQSVKEPARDIPVIAEVDVAILGGGPAGACAAVAAARAGASVVIVERHAYFGGMACAANVNIWHRLWSPDHTVKVIGGMPEEVLLRLENLKAVKNHSKDGRGDYTICTEAAKLVYDDMVIGAGVKVIFHAWLAGAVRGEGGKVEAAIIESKSGRGAIRAKVFIDCTGDADLCARAGAPTTNGDVNGLCQPPTLCFRIAGVDNNVAKENGVNHPTIQSELFKRTMDYNNGKYPTFLWGAPSVYREGEFMLAGTRVPGVDCSKTDDFTRAEVEARYQMRWVFDNLRTFKGYENISLVDIGAQIGVRETRRIKSDYELQEMDLLNGVRFHDTIAQGSYPVDIHNPTGPGIIFKYLDGTERDVDGQAQATMRRWDGAAENAPKRSTPCYCIPYRSLIPQTLDNVLVAGRCVSATHEAAGALRVMVNAMSFGHAAGRAAATAAEKHDGKVRSVDTAQLRDDLKNEGVPLLETSSSVKLQLAQV